MEFKKDIIIYEALMTTFETIKIFEPVETVVKNLLKPKIKLVNKVKPVKIPDMYW
jgi:hypothetical protein